MASSEHMATPEDDRRHAPGPGSLPLWNESYWFAFYDPAAEIGVTARLGMYPNEPKANIYLGITHHGVIAHSLFDTRAPLPPTLDDRLELAGLGIQLEEPLERFRVRYDHPHHGIDIAWAGISPTYLYPFPPQSTAEQVPRHIEHAGAVSGTVTIAGADYTIDCLGHRDHSWGGERDWSKLPAWDYVSGEIGRDFWFNAVRVTLAGSTTDTFLGCVWDGSDVLALPEIELDVQTADGGTRQLGVNLRLVDERDREHRIVGEEVLAIAPFQFERTWVKDGFCRFRYGDRAGHGILEHGYIQGD
jgi:hypothetical protein